MLGRRLVFAADEYYLLADRPFPAADAYEGFPMHEDGVGMARTFELEFTGAVDGADRRARAGFFAWVDGAPAEGYRARRERPRGRARSPCSLARRRRPSASSPASYGARVLAPLVDGLGRDDVRVVPVANEFFGGNTGVTGLHGRRRPGPRPGRRARRPPLPAARRLPVRGPLPRRHDARPTCPGPVEIVATDGIACAPALDEERPMSVAGASPSSGGRTSARARS